MKKLIIDTDPGIDDAMAIQLAFAHPGIELIGLTAIFGNVPVEIASRNALRLVELAEAVCPVATGAKAPLVQPPHPPADFVHGKEGFGTMPPSDPLGRPVRASAAEFIVKQINAAPGEVWLCPIGPLTNIALALELDPGIVGKVAGVSVMGGAVYCPGNVTPWAEANIWNDPHAAEKVLTAAWPLTLVGLDVTEKTRAGPEDFAHLADKSPVIGGFLNEAVQFYFDWHRQKDVHDGCFLHDPSAVLAVVEPELFVTRDTPLKVVTEGEEIGRTVEDAAGSQPVTVCTGVDAPALRARFLEVLATADDTRRD